MNLWNLSLRLKLKDLIMSINAELNASVFRHEFLFPYLNEAYSILIKSCSDILRSGKKYTIYNENILRDDLLRIAELKNKNLQFVWDTESRNLQSNEVRIDISLIYSLNIKSVEERISIECKLISLKKCKDYIDRNGIISFVNGKYSSKLPISGMIGFQENDNLNDIIIKLNKLLRSHSNIKTIQDLKYFSITNSFKDSYSSNHKRTKNFPPIEIYHLFFDFKKLIDINN